MHIKDNTVIFMRKRICPSPGQNWHTPYYCTMYESLSPSTQFSTWLHFPDTVFVKDRKLKSVSFTKGSLHDQGLTLEANNGLGTIIIIIILKPIL